MQNDFLFLCLGFKFLIIFTVLFGQNLSLFARGGVKRISGLAFYTPPLPYFLICVRELARWH